MSPYTVYNVLTKFGHNIEELHKNSPLEQPNDLFVEGEQIIGIEHFSIASGEKKEIRFTFKSRDDHHDWIAKNQVEYDTHRLAAEKFWSENGIQWDRYTSDDFYISEFTGRSFLTFKNFADLSISALDKKVIIEHLLPLGKYRNYLGSGEFNNDTNIRGARFLKEKQQAGVKRTGNTPSAYKYNNFPNGLMAYSFDHAIDIFIGRKNDLFFKLKKLCYDVEEVANTMIDSCNYGAVIAGHQSLGENFILHSHRLHDEDKSTLTIVVRLTHDDPTSAGFQVYPPFDESDPNLPHYYNTPDSAAFKDYAGLHSPTTIPLDSKKSIILFNASYCPHTVLWNDDVYLFFVYDHVTFKAGALEKIKQNAQVNKFYNAHKNTNLLYLGVE